MAKATVTSKGQVTVPKEVRDDLGLKSGSVLTFTRQADGVYLLSHKPQAISELKGWFGYTGPTRTIEEMDEAIARAASEQTE